MTELLIRLAKWAVRKIGGGALLLFSLLIVIMVTVVLGLQRVAAGLSNTPLILWVVLALLVAWLLARTRLSGRVGGLLAAVLIGAFGCVVLLVQTAKIGNKLWALASAGVQLARDAWQWSRGGPFPDWRLALLLLQDIGYSLELALDRAVQWLDGLVRGAPTYDPVAASLVWGAALWGVAAWAAWAVRRRDQPLAAVLPGGLLLVASLSYARGPVIVLGPFAAGTCLLYAVMNFQRQVRRWQAVDVDYAEDIHTDQGMWLVAFTTVVIGGALLVSWFSPHKAFEAARRWVQPRSEETIQVGSSLGLVVQTTESGAPGPGPGVLPRQHLLGSGPDLSQKVVMIVRVEGIQAYLSETASEQLPAYYWRTLTYDVYTGRGWITSDTQPFTYQAEQAASSAEMPSYRRLRQYVQSLEDLGLGLYFSGVLFTVDQDYQVDWRVVEDAADFFGAALQNAPQDGSYRVDSWVLQTGQVQLRAASSTGAASSIGAANQAYPQWIVDRYLQLPERLPRRVIDLAQELTAGAATPYDQALALETYLRQITYTLDVPAAPADRDVADYFLFDLKQGYCDYYATSMVVMARTVGLPARLVMGYAPGTLDPSAGGFVVTEANAHSWVEVYFPGLGWVEFEPTGGRPPIQRSEDLPLPVMSEQPASVEPPPVSAWLPWLRGLGWVGAFIGLLALLGLLVLLSDAWRLSRQETGAALSTLYRRLYRHGQRLGLSQAHGMRPGETPHEFAAALSDQVSGLPVKKRWKDALAPTGCEAQQLVDLYTQAIYSPQSPELADQRRAIQVWGKLRWRLWLARLFRGKGRRDKG